MLDQGPRRRGYPRSHYHDELLGGTTHTPYRPYGPGVSRAGTYLKALLSPAPQLQPGITPGYESYDTPHPSQQSPVGTRPRSEYMYSVQSANLNSPHHPTGFVPQQSPRPRLMALPRCLSQDSASVWDPWAGSHSLQPESASESYLLYVPGGFGFQQDMQYMTAASLSQRRAGVLSRSREFYS